MSQLTGNPIIRQDTKLDWYHYHYGRHDGWFKEHVIFGVFVEDFDKQWKKYLDWKLWGKMK